jgi:hypothetical protein
VTNRGKQWDEALAAVTPPEPPTLAQAERNVLDWWFTMDPDREATREPLKAIQEMKEFIEEPSPEEAADIVIALIVWFWQNGWSLPVYVWRKMTINRNRSWVKLPSGHYQHSESGMGE